MFYNKDAGAGLAFWYDTDLLTHWFLWKSKLIVLQELHLLNADECSHLHLHAPDCATRLIRNFKA